MKIADSQKKLAWKTSIVETLVKTNYNQPFEVGTMNGQLLHLYTIQCYHYYQ